MTKDPESEPLRREAVEFIGNFRWCHKIASLASEYVIGSELAIFDADLTLDDDSLWKTWILIGNVPPTFIPHEDFESLAPALENQILNFEAWADAVDRGETDLSKYTPVMYRGSVKEVEPTADMARNVRKKAVILREQVLKPLRNEIKASDPPIQTELAWPQFELPSTKP